MMESWQIINSLLYLICAYIFLKIFLVTISPKFGWSFHLIENPTFTYYGRSAFCEVLKVFILIFSFDSTYFTACVPV